MQTSLFDLENRYASLSEAGDPLERLDAVIDREIFRSPLERIDDKERRSAAGRTCRIPMFKMLILQRLHNLSDERLQYQVTDRLPFMRFPNLDLATDAPDARTVWAFRETLRAHRLVEPLFERLNQAAYCSEVLREHSKSLGHVPLIDHNPRAGEKIEFSPGEAQRYKERSQAERTNARLKDDYAGRHIRVRGHAKVMSYLVFGILALTADQLLRLLT